MAFECKSHVKCNVSSASCALTQREPAQLDVGEGEKFS